MNPLFRKTRPAFSLIELLTVIGIAALLVAMIVPAVSNMMDAGKRTKCASNLRQISQGIFAYANDNSGQVPYIADMGRTNEEFWFDAVCKSLNLAPQSWRPPGGIFRCPAAKTPSPNYTMSWTLTDRRLSMVKDSTKTVIIGEGDGASAAGINNSPPFGGLDALRHKIGANYLFVDGHIEFLNSIPTNGLLPQD